MVVFRRLQKKSSSGGDRQYSKIPMRCYLAATFQCRLRSQTTLSGRFLRDSRKTFAMRTMCFTEGRGQIGSWRSIESAGKAIHSSDNMRLTNLLKGTPSRPAQTLSSRHTQPQMGYTSQPAVRSTAGSSSQCLASM